MAEEQALQHGGAVTIATPVDRRDQLLGVRLRCLEIAAKDIRLVTYSVKDDEKVDAQVIERARKFEAYVFDGITD